QIIPPSIALVLLGDILSNAYQQAQLRLGVFAPKTVSVGDLFVGALIPGLLLVLAYAVYVWLACRLRPVQLPAGETAPVRLSALALLGDLLPPLLLIVAVLGSILGGIATPTEAAGIGALGALMLTLLKGRLSLGTLQEVMRKTVEVTAMVFL